MNSAIYEVIYCPEDDEYRVYCDICDKLSIEGFYKNNLNAQTHTNNKYKKIISNNTTQVNMDLLCEVCDRSIIENESEKKVPS